jgi:ParB family chromosome partitioning protein
VAERGMGRGLAAILTVSGLPDDDLRRIPVDLVDPNPRQPRTSFDDETIQALAESVRERGVLQPVLARPVAGGRYELIAGERRWRAAQLAGLTEVPALVRDRDDSEALEVALIENMAREDLNPVEEARACAALVEELGLTREDVGRRVGRSRVAVSNLLRLLDLPDEVLTLIERGSLTEGHGRALLLTDDHAERRRLGREAVASEWSVRVVEAKAREAGKAPARAATRSSASGLHPDQEEAAAVISDALGAVLGTDVRVRAAAKGYRVELSFADPEEALALARRIGPRRVA